MTTTIKDEAGVTMAGPDDPALAAAKARDLGGVAKRVDARSPEQMSAEFLEYQDTCRKTGRHATNFEDWAERTFCGSFQSASEDVPMETNNGPIENLGLTVRQIEKRGLAGGSVGDVSSRQAGILPTRRRPQITPDTVGAARRAARALGHDLDHAVVEAMLEAALHGE